LSKKLFNSGGVNASICSGGTIDPSTLKMRSDCAGKKSVAIILDMMDNGDFERASIEDRVCEVQMWALSHGPFL